MKKNKTNYHFSSHFLRYCSTWLKRILSDFTLSKNPPISGFTVKNRETLKKKKKTPKPRSLPIKIGRLNEQRLITFLILLNHFLKCTTCVNKAFDSMTSQLETSASGSFYDTKFVIFEVN